MGHPPHLMSGEFELIARFVRCFDVEPSPRGPGDDCAVVPPSKFATCVTTDALVEGVHFSRSFSFEEIGHKALAVNLSDLAAMGARAAWFTVALALPARVRDADVVKLGRGMSKLARVHGAKLIGGNVTRARELSITITACGSFDGATLARDTGEFAKTHDAQTGEPIVGQRLLVDHARGGEPIVGQRPLVRSGAKVGHRIFVSGTLGDAAGGLLRGAPRELVRAQRRPTPHLDFARRARGFISAAIDVSDGLLQDLGHLCTASGVAAELDSAALPLSRALVKFAGTRALDLALRGGEDYVLLFTAPDRHADALRALGAFEIGQVIRGSGVRVDGKTITGRGGFTHR